MKIIFTSGLFITDRPGRWSGITKGFFEPLAKVFESHGHEVMFITNGNAQVGVRSKFRCIYSDVVKNIEASKEFLSPILNSFKPDIVFIWNGNSDGDIIVKDICAKSRSNPKIIYGELGWFTQKTTLQFDYKGTNLNCSLKDLNYNELEVDDRIYDYIKMVQGGRKIKEEYTLVILQDEEDTNIFKFSPYKKMQDFVDHIVERFSYSKIVIRPHPSNKDIKLFIENDDVMVDYKTELYNQLANANIVIGINSTVLMEALWFYKPVIAYGKTCLDGAGIFNEPNSSEIIDTEKVTKLLSEIIFKRSFDRSKLTDRDYIKEYPLFKELIYGKNNQR